MNYLRIYCNLIRKAEKRGYKKKNLISEIYLEKHHIFPKSIFGNNNRVVLLTAKEHYIAHVLLEKIYIKRYGLYDKKTIKMTCAHIAMKCKNKYYNSNLYETARIRHSNNMKNSLVLKDNGKRVANYCKNNKVGFFSAEQQSISGKKGGKIGGKLGGKRCYELGVGAFSLSENEKFEKNSKGGKIGGRTTYERGVGIFSRSKEKMLEDAKKAAEASKNVKYKCLVTGKITNAGALTMYQRKRNIDTSQRIRVF